MGDRQFSSKQTQISPSLGSPKEEMTSKLANGGDADTTFTEISGEGAFYSLQIFTDDVTDSQYLGPIFTIDGEQIFYYGTFGTLNDRGYNDSTSLVQLPTYTADGLIVFQLVPNFPIPFRESLKLSIHNNSLNDISVITTLVYSKI